MRFLGTVAKPIRISAALTSQFGSFALVLVESMACWTLVISLDWPSGPRDVREDGRAGVPLLMNAPAALAETMAGTTSDDQGLKTLIAAGAERAVRFDVHTVATIWTALLEACLAAPRKARTGPKSPLVALKA